MSKPEQEEEYLITCQVRYRANKKARFIQRPAAIHTKQTFNLIPVAMAEEAGLTEGGAGEAEMKLEAKVGGSWVQLADTPGSDRVWVHWFPHMPSWQHVALSGDVLSHSKKTTVVAVESKDD